MAVKIPLELKVPQMVCYGQEMFHLLTKVFSCVVVDVEIGSTTYLKGSRTIIMNRRKNIFTRVIALFWHLSSRDISFAFPLPYFRN